MKTSIKWHVEKRKISDLIPHKDNPRIFTEKGMKDLDKSINKIGMAQPINITPDGIILSGHARIEALKGQGVAEVDCYVPDRSLSEKEQKEVLIRMNANIAGIWDNDKLSTIFNFDDLADWGMDNLADIFGEIPEPEIEEDDFVEPEPEEVEEIKTDIEQGDLFILGEHRILCGDSTNQKDVAMLMGGDDIKADMVHTDPPYGVSYKGTNNPNGKEWEIIKNDKLRGDTLFLFLLEASKNIKRFLKPDGAFYMWYANSNHMQFENAIRGAELKPKQVIIWDKGMVLGHSDYHWAYEPCFYGCHEGKNCKWCGDRSQQTFWAFNRKELTDMKKDELLSLLKNLQDGRTCWRIKRDSAMEYIHPTQKPIALPAKAIKNSSQPGDVVLDLFGGSGSTMIACEQLKRQARLMELDPKYVHVEICRWVKYTGKDVYRIRAGKKELYKIFEQEIDNLAVKD